MKSFWPLISLYQCNYSQLDDCTLLLSDRVSYWIYHCQMSCKQPRLFKDGRVDCVWQVLCVLGKLSVRGISLVFSIYSVIQALNQTIYSEKFYQHLFKYRFLMEWQKSVKQFFERDGTNSDWQNFDISVTVFPGNNHRFHWLKTADSVTLRVFNKNHDFIRLFITIKI